MGCKGSWGRIPLARETRKTQSQDWVFLVSEQARIRSHDPVGVVGMEAQCASMPPRRRDTSRRAPLRQQGRGGWPQRGNPACPPKLLPRGYPLHSLCCVKPKSWKFSYFSQHGCIFCSYAFRRIMHAFFTRFLHKPLIINSLRLSMHKECCTLTVKRGRVPCLFQVGVGHSCLG